MRGKEGAGLSTYCPDFKTARAVSVPLRGKEGAGLLACVFGMQLCVQVSVPLRGKEGAGPDPAPDAVLPDQARFPSPCGVRRVRDFINVYLDPLGIHRFRPLAG